MTVSSVLIAATAMFQSASPPVSSAVFKGFEGLGSFSKISPYGTEETVYVSPDIDAGIDWNECIASWDVQASPGAQLSVAVRAVYPDRNTGYFNLGIWTPDRALAPRTSVPRQKDADGSVSIDTLRVSRMARIVQVVVSVKPGPDGKAPDIRFFGLSFSNRTAPKVDDTVPVEAQPLEVPELFQMDYPNGGGYCSPTSVTMVLDYWSQKLARPELKKDVPEVVEGVFDKAFDGTGNWPFNTAYAASFPGMRGYITRFTSTDEIRQWVGAGFPVITSGSIFLLQGKEAPKDDPGHLTVVVGFTKDGDPILNDPGRKQVRQVYKRADFEKAWDTSDRTVYLIYPEAMTPPPDPLGHWFHD